ncbi:MAG: SulP family inorganic anion transporter [Myxococcales bacterium]|nr:SulP family inorganic anion transporter [Myxococcales bacterium]
METGRGSRPGAPDYLPFRELLRYRSADLPRDALAALTVAVLTVPQALAYAVIAGVPPIMGLYAATVPTLIGSLARSSRHVITGPSNALSLVCASVIAGAVTADPVSAAIALCAAVGLWQLVLGGLRLGTLVDFISQPVVQGYITGAATLILLGQLPVALGTSRVDAVAALGAGTLPALHTPSLAVGALSIGLVLLLRRLDRRLPAHLIALLVAVVASLVLGLRSRGVVTVADGGAIAAGLPPLTIPDAGLMRELMLGALACTVLSLVESTSVARTLAGRSGQRIDNSVEFFGQGLANLAGAFFGAYPTSGSLGRSALNERAGARTRLAGVLAGLIMLLVLLVAAPLLEHVPMATLAGLIVVVAFDLIDRPALRSTLRSGRADAAALCATLLGTWVLRLDLAIAFGVCISLMLYLRRARLLVVSELAVDGGGRLREVDPDERDEVRSCDAIRVLHVEGSLFFGASGELRAALDESFAHPGARVLVLRLKRTGGLDATTAGVLADAAERARVRDQTLVLAGLRADAMDVLTRTSALERIGADAVFPSQPGWFVAMRSALAYATRLVGDHACGDSCPVGRYAGRASELPPPLSPRQDV